MTGSPDPPYDADTVPSDSTATGVGRGSAIRTRLPQDSKHALASATDSLSMASNPALVCGGPGVETYRHSSPSSRPSTLSTHSTQEVRAWTLITPLRPFSIRTFSSVYPSR